jgi:23S rRNA (pseudouridine1915-N3)-methyltransferase
MRILLAAIGRARSGPERALYQHYAARLAWPLSLKELEARKAASPAEQVAREGELLLAAIPDKARVVVLDAAGQLLTSEALAGRLGAWRDGGARDLAFLIGGADGLAPSVLRRADLRLALGRLTWPHLLVRGMLAEQLYRAQQILGGHPYHRG